MPNNKKMTMAAAIVLAAVLAVAAVCWVRFGPKGVEGTKTLTIQVTHGDGNVNTFTVTTEAEFLGDALMEAGLIQGVNRDYGIFIQTVDGEFADETQNQFWVYTRDGQQVNYGVDMCPTADGEHYEFIRKTF